MSKVIRAVNTMIENRAKIDRVSADQGYIFFLYKDKYVWSISKSSEKNYSLVFYPEESSPEQMLNYDMHYYFQNSPAVSYETSEIGTQEAIDSFAELFNLVKEKVYGMDKIFNDILSDEYDPFKD